MHTQPVLILNEFRIRSVYHFYKKSLIEIHLASYAKEKIFLPSCLVFVGVGLDGNGVNGVMVVAAVPFAIVVQSESVEEEVDCV